MANLHNRILKLDSRLLFAIAGVLILIAVVPLAIYFFTHNRASATVEIHGRADTSFRVFYQDNDLFPENPVPPNLHLLMSFTDYIEVDSRFYVGLSVETDIHYSYTAVERLVIRHSGPSNHVVFEESWILSEIYGHARADRLHFPAGNNGPATYTLVPYPRINQYQDFARGHTQQMDGISSNFRGFTAELIIEFTYMIHVPEFAFVRSISRGYRLPLSDEVYTIATGGAGPPNFAETIVIPGAALLFELTLPVTVILVLILTLSGYLIFCGLKGRQPGGQRYWVQGILRKYGNEIVASNVYLPLVDYTVLPVYKFEELLKLAINLSKHIVCYRNNMYAEFAVVVDEYAYYYRVDY